MRRKRLLWQLYPSYLLLTAASLLAVSWFSYKSLTHYSQKRLTTSLRTEAELIGELSQAYIEAGSREELLHLITDASLRSGSRIEVFGADGTILVSSGQHRLAGADQGDSEEVRAALRGTVELAIRQDSESGEEIALAAVPVKASGRVIAVIRVAQPADISSAAFRALLVDLGLVALVIFALAVIVSFYVSRRIARPLRELKQTAEQIAQGDLESWTPALEYEEVAGLAGAMNRMAEQLEERFKTLQQQRLEQETIVSSMIEGVVAIDNSQQLLNMNNAAARLLNLNPPEVIGRNIAEIIRNTDLQRFIAQTLSTSEPLEGDITLIVGQEERNVQVHGTLLRTPEGEIFGALVVLNDITRLRKLENVRRDFVANVSHELKTPITSIKGFVETIIDTADLDSDEAKRFLQIISRQANRLHAIIEDLLKLSRIEQGIDRGEIELEVGKLKPVLNAAVHACQPQAQAKEMSIAVHCDPELRARINPPLLEQALVNLIDNAVKYGSSGQTVTVAAESTEDLVGVTVADQGPGIAKEHLSRLFERFYRVDRARSSSQGGTGLGLAIVKHIVISHGGTIGVESEVGKGTKFTLKLARR